ncbi:insulinase family protein [Pokkaliibacter sp. MBI-7]|uniref:insulinase family protein n=1 Tax=Pokkaliibacter sp. MBI-7 TaxID=3040600 RepID=UPI0024490596|nr:insulinase family protein [Pokkaliibacter sp. MBI-7]MDH2434626.1 insulinase family protein [Pokkaliibacter sp. MBI-7]
MMFLSLACLRRRAAALAVVTGLATSPLHAAATVPGPSDPSVMALTPAQAEQALAWDKRVVRGELANGLRYFLLDSRTLPGASQQQLQINLLVDAGALDEEENQLGVAHMVEHMVFHDSSGLPQGTRAALVALGLRQGREFNAVTNAEMTRYMLTLKQPTSERTAALLQVLAQMAFHANLRQARLDEERLVIKEEWRGKLGLRQRINDQKKALLRSGSRYVDRPVIGTESSIDQTPASALQRFYADWYAPNNMALVAMGPMDPTQLAVLIEQQFGSATARTLPVRHPRDPQLHDQLQLRAISDKESSTHQLVALLRFPEGDSGEQADGLAAARQRLVAYLARELLTAQISRQREVLPDGVKSLSVTRGEVSDHVGILGFAVSVEPEGYQQGLRALLTEITRLQQHGIYADDFARAKEKVRTTAENNIEAAQQRGDLWLVKLVDAVSRQRPLPDARLSNRLSLSLIDSITLAEVNQQLRRWLSAEDRLLYTQSAGGVEVSLPEPAAIRQLWRQIGEQPLAPLQPYQQVTVRQMPEPRLPRGQLLSQQDTPDLGITEWRFANGDSLVRIRPDHFRQDDAGDALEQEAQARSAPAGDSLQERLSFRAVSSAGFNQPGSDPWLPQLAGKVAINSGLEGWSKSQLRLWEKNQQVNLSVEQQPQQLSFSATLRNERLPALLAYYHQLQSQPWLDPQVVADTRDTLLKQLAEPVRQPLQQFSQALAQARAGDEQGLQPAQAMVRALNTRQLQQQWQAQLRVPVRYYVVTDMADEKLLDLALRYLASVPRDTKAAYPTTVASPVTGEQHLELAINSEPQAWYSLRAELPMVWSPERAVQMAALGQLLQDTLRQQLREQVQGIYRLESELTLTPPPLVLQASGRQQAVNGPGRLQLSLRFSSDPARIDQLAKMSQQVLQHLPAAISPAWLARQRTQFAEAEQARLGAGVAATLLHRLQLSEEQFGHSGYLHTMNGLPQSFDEQALRQLASGWQWQSWVEGVLRPDPRLGVN